MNRMEVTYTPEHYFAALKLLEQLHKDGKMTARMFRSILNDYTDIVDLSKFTIIDEKTKEEKK